MMGLGVLFETFRAEMHRKPMGFTTHTPEAATTPLRIAGLEYMPAMQFQVCFSSQILVVQHLINRSEPYSWLAQIITYFCVVGPNNPKYCPGSGSKLKCLAKAKCCSRVRNQKSESELPSKIQYFFKLKMKL